MTRQWGRLVRVTASGKGGSVTFDGAQSPEAGFKINFSVARGIGSKQDSATITLYNLTRSRRNQMGEEYDKIKLEVGYKDGGLSLLYEGDIRDVSHTKTTPDIVTTIQCGDGDQAAGKGSVAKTFPAGTKPKEIVEHLIKNLPGTKAGRVEGLDDLPPSKRPVTVYGYTGRALDTQSRQHKFYWNVQNGEVNTVKNDKHLGVVVKLSSTTGLIGIPEETDKGIKFKALLNTALKPGFAVEILSDFLDETSGRDKRATDAGGGIFRISSATCTGDTRDAEFYAECECARVQGDKVTK